jgi:hypothetical protein
MAAFILLLMLASPSPAGGNGNVTLRGKLQVSRAGTVVEIEGRRVALTSHDQNIAATLRDSRLDGRDLKLVGEFRAGGSFDVHQFYVARPDADYRVIYFCDVCNITTFSPGDCVCCQQPVEPIEVLPTDPRIYQEKLDPPAPKP